MEAATAAPVRSPEEERLAAEAKAADEAAEVGAEAGGKLEGEGEGEQGLPPLELEGQGQLSLKIAGAKPDVATAKLKGGAIAIPAGEYQPGEIVEAIVRLRCTGVAVADKWNHTTGEVNERERRHDFHMLSIERISAR